MAGILNEGLSIIPADEFPIIAEAFFLKLKIDTLVNCQTIYHRCLSHLRKYL